MSIPKDLTIGTKGQVAIDYINLESFFDEIRDKQALVKELGKRDLARYNQAMQHVKKAMAELDKISNATSLSDRQKAIMIMQDLKQKGLTEPEKKRLIINNAYHNIEVNPDDIPEV